MDNWELELTITESRRELRENSKRLAESMMGSAEFVVTKIWQLANEYWPDAREYDAVREPWWLFETSLYGMIVIGRRKRVYVIDWSSCTFRGIITTDDVTKSEHHVHAWSVEKAVEYLRALHAGMKRATQ